MIEHTPAVASLAPLSTELHELAPDGDYFLGPERLAAIASILVSTCAAGR